MNSSDENSSSDESPVPAKRTRTDTYGASSHGSELMESDDDSSENPSPDNYATDDKIHFNYTEPSNERGQRLSRSSLSENCSSPNEQYDDRVQYARFKDNDSGDASGSETTPAPKENMFYSRTDDSKELDSYASHYSDVSKRIMNSMGHKPGRGLGKFEHGRVEPVEASTQKGRRGFGLTASVVGDVPKDFKWTPDEAIPEAKEEVFWMPESREDPPSSDVLENWLLTGEKKLTIDDETNFVDPHILKGVLESKTIFDNLQDEDMRNARFRSNPYETIGSVIFLNRAAVKMANIDAVFDFKFTNPKNRKGEPTVSDKDLLYFADVCAGPGGFSEYVLYRRGWRAKGFGFTLKGKNDFKLSDFYAGTSETFNPYYGEKDDGNIFDPENLMSLKNHVLMQTDDIGVHFLMADGGFSVEGQENIQEILSKQLYLCQCLAALMLVRNGGNFVVKLFDVFTSFSVGLVYIMYKCFEKVCIHKPVTSRPANSERYLVCFWKKPGTEAVENYLFEANTILWNNKDSAISRAKNKNIDVVELVPMTVIREDNEFYEYIYKSNCLIGEKQIQNLLKIAQFSKDKNLKDPNQAEMRKRCLELWKLPDKVRTQPKSRNPDETLSEIINIMKLSSPSNQSIYNPIYLKNMLSKPPQYIENKKDVDVFENIYDWRFTVLSSDKGSPDLKIFLGCSGTKVYQLEGASWKSAVDLHINLPAKTLLYGEVVKEFSGEGNGQLHSKALHVIDAVMLGGLDISHESLTERNNQCALFCTALEKYDNNQNTLRIRHKRFFNMESFPSSVNNLETRMMKGMKRALTINVPKRNRRDEKFYTVGSLLFIKEVKDPWKAHISKKYKTKYYFALGPKGECQSVYELPAAAALEAYSAFGSRIVWPWGAAAGAIFEGKTSSCISRVDMEKYILNKHVI